MTASAATAIAAADTAIRERVTGPRGRRDGRGAAWAREADVPGWEPSRPAVARDDVRGRAASGPSVSGGSGVRRPPMVTRRHDRAIRPVRGR